VAIDAVGLAALLQKREGIPRFNEALGIVLDDRLRRALLDHSKFGEVPPLLVALIDRARNDPDGIAYERVKIGGRWTHYLVVRHGARITLDFVNSQLSGPASVWPELKSWAKVMAKNRERAEAWAANEVSGRLTIPLGAAPAPAADDDAALVRRVLEAPEDDAPRLVYADWLLERGDARGELIRLSCAHAAAERGSPEQRELDRQLQPLLLGVGKKITGMLRPRVEEATLRRGFVHTVRMTIPQVEQHGAAVLSEHPVERLIIREPRLNDVQLRALAAAPALRLVRHLQLEGQTKQALAPLTGARFERLHTLELRDVGHSPADWEKLFGELDAPALATVDLDGFQLSAGIWRGLARNPRLGALRNVRALGESGLDGKRRSALATGALAELAARRALETLELIVLDQGIADAAIVPFFAKVARARLRALVLSGTPVTDALLAAIARSPRLEMLEDLSLNETEITADGALALLRTRHRLQHFSAGHDFNGWTPEAHEAVARALLALPARHPMKSVGFQKDAIAPALQKQLEKRFEVHTD
jgi:uncharacterized protein (TIGR02996 family)